MHRIFLLMENTYCAELVVSSEQRKIGLCPLVCSTPFSVVSHKQCEPLAGKPLWCSYLKTIILINVMIPFTIPHVPILYLKYNN